MISVSFRDWVLYYIDGQLVRNTSQIPMKHSDVPSFYSDDKVTQKQSNGLDDW